LINFYFEGDYELGIKDYKGFAKSLSIHNDFIEMCKNNPQLIKLSISCFSEKYDNILLWSFYADNHKGICLEYKTIFNEGNNCLLFDSSDLNINHPVPMLKVNYVEKPLEKINVLYTKCFTEQLKIFLSTKSKIWEYENETRCIISNSQFKNYPNAKLKKKCINRCFFGINTDENEKYNFKELVNLSRLS